MVLHGRVIFDFLVSVEWVRTPPLASTGHGGLTDGSPIQARP